MAMEHCTDITLCDRLFSEAFQGDLGCLTDCQQGSKKKKSFAIFPLPYQTTSLPPTPTHTHPILSGETVTPYFSMSEIVSVSMSQLASEQGSRANSRAGSDAVAAVAASAASGPTGIAASSSSYRQPSPAHSARSRGSVSQMPLTSSVSAVQRAPSATSYVSRAASLFAASASVQQDASAQRSVHSAAGSPHSLASFQPLLEEEKHDAEPEPDHNTSVSVFGNSPLNVSTGDPAVVENTLQVDHIASEQPSEQLEAPSATPQEEFGQSFYAESERDAAAQSSSVMPNASRSLLGADMLHPIDSVNLEGHVTAQHEASVSQQSFGQQEVESVERAEGEEGAMIDDADAEVAAHTSIANVPSTQNGSLLATQAGLPQHPSSDAPSVAAHSPATYDSIATPHTPHAALHNSSAEPDGFTPDASPSPLYMSEAVIASPREGTVDTTYAENAHLKLQVQDLQERCNSLDKILSSQAEDTIEHDVIDELAVRAERIKELEEAGLVNRQNQEIQAARIRQLEAEMEASRLRQATTTTPASTKGSPPAHYADSPRSLASYTGTPLKGKATALSKGGVRLSPQQIANLNSGASSNSQSELVNIAISLHTQLNKAREAIVASTGDSFEEAVGLTIQQALDRTSPRRDCIKATPRQSPMQPQVRMSPMPGHAMDASPRREHSASGGDAFRSLMGPSKAEKYAMAALKQAGLRESQRSQRRQTSPGRSVAGQSQRGVRQVDGGGGGGGLSRHTTAYPFPQPSYGASPWRTTTPLGMEPQYVLPCTGLAMDRGDFARPRRLF